MGLQGTNLKSIPVTVLTAGFQAICTMQVFGSLQVFLNDEQKPVFPLKQITLHGLEIGNPAASMNLEELFVRKDECQVLAFERMFSQEETGLMPRVEQLAAYTSHFVIQGGFHMGSDAPLGDFIGSSRSRFMGVTDAYVFPLFEPQAAIIQEAPLIFVYRDAVRMHHRV